MANRTSNTNVAEKSDHLFLTAPVAASTHLYFGQIVARNSAGFAVAAGDTAGLRTLGIAEQEVDNSAGANGAATVVAKRAPRWIDNSGTDPVAQADMGKVCYVEDDHTVCKVGGTNKIAAGVALELSADASLVCVDFFLAPIAI